jgi:hypothetical protein
VADDERPAVGTVAEEAARLLDALGGWASTAQAGYAARTAPGPDAPAEPADATGVPGDGPDVASGDAAGDAGAAADESRCASCGAQDGMGQAVTCQLCPVCQGIGLLRSVRPETVDRLADLAGALAATLRDIAGQRRADAGATAPRTPHPPSSRVHDIAVADEDTPGSATS